MVDVLMVCVGSRGDTQPFVELALALKAAGISSVVAAHPEFEGFVQNAGCCFAPVRSSLPEALHTTEAGKQMRENTGSSSLRFAPAFFMQLFQDWFEDTLQLTEQYKPSILLLTLMPYLAGGFRVPELIERRLQQQQQQQQQQQHGDSTQPAAQWPRPQLLVVYTVPTHPTWAYMPPSTGVGLSARFGFINRLLWWVCIAMLNRLLYAPSAAQLAKQYGLQPVTWVEYENKHRPPSLCCYSADLLPKPRDLPDSVHIVGPWLPEGSFISSTATAAAAAAAAAAEGTVAAEQPAGVQHQQLQEAVQQGLPEDLVAYISSARSAGRRVVYVGLGSMLGCMFSTEEATAILAVLAGAVLRVQQQHPCCAIIHCATDLSGGAAVLPHPAAVDSNSSSSKSSDADDSASAESAAAAGPPPYMWLDVPVSHSLLLPLVDLAVHHGGMGTTHAILAAGVPALVLPVAQAADQPFWGDVVQRRKAGRLASKPASKITTEQLAGDLQEVLGGLEGFKQATVALSQQMQERQGKQAAVKFIQGMLS